MNKFKHGFTLIELLVIISILGLISSVALANLQDAKEKAKVAAGEQFHATIYHSQGDHTVGIWEFDEGNGSVASDSSGNGLEGVINGATFVSGLNGTALSFDGNDYIAPPEGGEIFPNPGNNGQMTVITWIKPANAATPNTLFTVAGPNCTAIKVGISGGSMHVQQAGDVEVGAVSEDEPTNPGPGVDEQISEDHVLENNAWQNVAYVFNNGTVQSFVNGTLFGSTDGVGTTDCEEATWIIGADATFGSGYQGLMDSLRVYGTTLTASEIQNIYAEGRTERSTLVSR